MFRTDNYDLAVTEITDAPPDIREVSANFPLIDAILKDHEDLFDSYVPLSSVKSKGDASTPIYFDANGVAQTITSYGGTSARATADGSGNVLTSFYLPKQNVVSKGNATTPIYFDNEGVAQTIDSLLYLPIAGGTMTGGIIKRNVENSTLTIHGSTGWDTGATIELKGKNVNDDTKSFCLIRSNNGTTYTDFRVTPTSVTVNNNKILIGNIKNLAQNGYVDLENGLQIRWGRVSVTRANGYFSFNKAFTNSCVNLVVSHYQGGTTRNYELLFESQIVSKSGANIFIDQSNSGKEFCYIAIGY